ncbi:MAG: CopD family protein [Sulfuriferula multivorans]|uniref:Protoporphyrinogen IX oxidase n=1 Tax=Sulfuriferula multivorans TaxID=1559896 RepID=A0A7C9TBF3_9PROT|nr:CopD family protein [Sulfuriferula multivorans]
MLWLKSFHIVMVVSWFAGLFYLPRLFVNLAMEENDAAYNRLLLMANKLHRFVSPIMWLTLITGIWLWLAYFPISMNWMWLKLILVIGLVGYHHVCKRLLRGFAARQNTKSHVWFRWFNEIPVVVLLIVVLLVVLKPF